MSRDEQFQGFAKALLEEMVESGDVYIDAYNEHWRASWEEILARRAYDLAESAAQHALLSLRSEDSGFATQEIIETIPDMPELPKEQDER